MLFFSGVRRGRYSIAIRTQAILEAKARQSSTEIVAPKRQRLNDTVIEEISNDDMENLSFDVFDGLLDISGKLSLCDEVSYGCVAYTPVVTSVMFLPSRLIKPKCSLCSSIKLMKSL